MFAVNFYLPREKAAETPSIKDGVPEEVEKNNLRFAIDCMQKSAELMDLESVVFTRAAILFHRFYCKRSVQNHDVRNMIAPALVLACKLEDAKPNGVGRDLRLLMRMAVTVVHYVLQLKDGAADSSLLEYTPGEGEYNKLFDILIERERELLATLGFIFYVEHPQRFLLFFIKILQLDEQVAQCAWNYMMDSLRLAIHCYVPGNVMATACIYLAFRNLGIAMPNSGPPWWELFDTNADDLIYVCNNIMGLYTGKVQSSYTHLKPKPKVIIEEKKKLKDKDAPPKGNAADGKAQEKMQNNNLGEYLPKERTKVNGVIVNGLVSNEQSKYVAHVKDGTLIQRKESGEQVARHRDTQADKKAKKRHREQEDDIDQPRGMIDLQRHREGRGQFDDVTRLREFRQEGSRQQEQERHKTRSTQQVPSKETTRGAFEDGRRDKPSHKVGKQYREAAQCHSPLTPEFDWDPPSHESAKNGDVPAKRYRSPFHRTSSTPSEHNHQSRVSRHQSETPSPSSVDDPGSSSSSSSSSYHSAGYVQYSSSWPSKTQSGGSNGSYSQQGQDDFHTSRRRTPTSSGSFARDGSKRQEGSGTHRVEHEVSRSKLGSGMPQQSNAAKDSHATGQYPRQPSHRKHQHFPENGHSRHDSNYGEVRRGIFETEGHRKRTKNDAQSEDPC